MHSQRVVRQPRMHTNRLVLITLLMTVILSLSCIGVWPSMGEGRQLQIGRYRASSYHPPAGTYMLVMTLSTCEGGLRYGATFGVCHLATWGGKRGAPFVYNGYRFADPRCQV
jgi:hypothetical protein